MWAQGSKTSTGCRNALEPRKRSTHSSHKTMKEERTQKEKELVQKKIEDFINPIIGGHVPPGECIVGKLQTALEELFQSTPDEKPVVSDLESALREFIDSGGDQKCWPRILQINSKGSIFLNQQTAKRSRKPKDISPRASSK